MPPFLAGPLLLLGMMVLLVTLPITLPIVGLLEAIDARRRRRCAEQTACIRCGHVLGVAALTASDTAQRAEWAKHAQPGVRYRRVRLAHARCCWCGADYTWAGGRLIATEPPAPGPSI